MQLDRQRAVATPRSHKSRGDDSALGCVWQDTPWVTIAVRDAVPRLIAWMADVQTNGVRRLSYS